MSRRAPAGPDRTEQNRATLKQLVKLESNKSCADCKRNKHPRWASWNIGVFVCIRCSGIHRGMGTHISRVKSVDLDSWTDEQTQSMLKWGNARANRYWEHKLGDGHIPNDAKIENFIRTKYDSRRWVMDGPVPDPSTLGDDGADDDVPLNIVREKAIERSASQRNGSAPAGALPQPPRARQPQVDLFGDSFDSEPARPSTTEPSIQRPGPPKAPAAPPKQTRPGESLLGLDFLGGAQSAAPPRPASTGSGTPGAPGRADLKSSILSLYAPKPAAPAPAPQQQQQQQQSNMNLFGGMSSPPLTSPVQQQPQSNAQALGGLGDAFGSLSFSSPQQSQPKPSAFSNLTSPTAHARQPSSSKSALSGGSFFDVKPVPPAQPAQKAFSPPSNPPPISTMQTDAFSNDWGDFSSGPSPPASSVKSPPAATNSMGDLFGLSSPAPAPSAPKPTVSSPPPQKPSYASNSAFNLSQPAPAPPKPAAPAPVQASNFSSMSNMDAWGSNDAWATPDPPAGAQPAAPPAQASVSSFKPAPAPAPAMSGFDSGWGDAPAQAPAPAQTTTTTTSSGGFAVQQDDEFGGWSHASPVATNTGPKQGGLGGNQDDLFGNVWE